MRDFDGLELALGSLRGWRDWGLTHEGVLQPLTHSGDWVPGENVAACRGYASDKRAGIEEHHSGEEKKELRRIWADTHGMDNCEHGFYAYFDGAEQQYYRDKPLIRGVIEGYGEMLIGSKGFRASKAKILALSVAPHDGMWSLDMFFVERLKANYPNIPVFDSEMAMRAEFTCPEWDSEVVLDEA